MKDFYNLTVEEFIVLTTGPTFTASLAQLSWHDLVGQRFATADLAKAFMKSWFALEDEDTRRTISASESRNK